MKLLGILIVFLLTLIVGLLFRIEQNTRPVPSPAFQPRVEFRVDQQPITAL